jgi:hypothetical protein
MTKVNKLNKLNKLKKKTQKKTYNKIQYGGEIDEKYINNVFKFIYNDICVEDTLLIPKNDKNKYIRNNILDYEFFNKEKLEGITDNKNNYSHPDEEKHEDIDFNLTLYDKWVAKRFDIERSYSHIRIIDNDPKSGHRQSPNHREFNNDLYGNKNTWNVLCYYKNENCNLYNNGLGIIYKSNDKDKDGNNIIKRVALPVINGLTLKIRDCYFFHFTPPLKYKKSSTNNSTSNNSTSNNSTSKNIKRVIVRSYHDNKYEESIFCYNDKIKNLPLYQFTKKSSTNLPHTVLTPPDA